MSSDNGGYQGRITVELEVAVYVGGREPDDPVYERAVGLFGLHYDDEHGVVVAFNVEPLTFPAAYRDWGEVSSFAMFAVEGPPLSSAGAVDPTVPIKAGSRFGFEAGGCRVWWDSVPEALRHGTSDTLVDALERMLSAGSHAQPRAAQ